ncbi:MAG: 30S ribosomal protein S11 [Candidatus Anstonellales archaeon]
MVEEKVEARDEKENIENTEKNVTKNSEQEKVIQEKQQTSEEKRSSSRKSMNDLKFAIVWVYSSKNDTILTATDLSGAETLATSSGGKMVKADREEGKPYAAMQATMELVNKLKEKGINAVNIHIRAPGGNGSRIPGQGAQAVVRTIARSGLIIGKILDVTPIPSDTTRRPGGRRGRRV